MEFRLTDRIGIGISAGRSFDLMTGKASLKYVYPVASGRNWQIGAGRLVGFTVHWLGCYASINLLIAKPKEPRHG